MKKNCKKTNQQGFREEKLYKEKEMNYMPNGKDIIIHLIAGLMKRIKKWKIKWILLYKMSQYFPKPYEPFGGDINVKVDLSNYATKADIKNISHVDTSSFPLKSNLATLKTEVDKLILTNLYLFLLI